MGATEDAVVYDKGVHIWLPDPDIVWMNAKILSVVDGIITCEDDNGRIVSVPVSKRPFVRNPVSLEAVDDLTHLSYLHEPAVLNTLRTRYSTMNMYTYCGIVLVAINPFQSLDIYSDDLIREYHGKVMGDLEPHLFALAEEAYANMSRLGKDQSIVVSGESGAGKTVSAKYTMRYFATVGGSMGDRQMEKQVMASNPVMEAFGNAKTTRNNNSSRFGKYIAIQFDQKFAIAGATTMTYLLEKSRVVFQNDDERSYHIFYQLCASVWERCPPELEALKLTHCQNFHYINQGKCPAVERVNDAAEFEETRRSMQMVGITTDLQYGIFRILAAILHLGNIDIFCRRTEDAQIRDGDEALANAVRLLDIPLADAQKWLLKRRIAVGRDVVIKTSTKEQALSVRDAFAKHLYAAIFDWVVTKINSVLQNPNHKGRFIGVLDIYGFELFDVNSFEQFCINYANEKLQQQFNQHVFKLEQEEYVREKIQWSFIDFYDNQPCIDLIEDRLGVLALLDEEARLPKGSDMSFLDKLKTNHAKKEHFSLPRFGTNLFVIHHFASQVVYTVDGFLEKNKDAVSTELIDLLASSSDPFLQSLFAQENKAPSQTGATLRQGTAKAKASTVGSQFKNSLQNLMETISSTTPHYCRCIKPNQAKEPFLFEEKNTIEQLRACGVLETIRISAAGYPSRSSYEDFRERYAMLLKGKEVTSRDTKDICNAILTKIINNEDKYQFGETKIFFRAGQVAYLEKLRLDRMRDSILMIQKIVRGYQTRRRYLLNLLASTVMQRLSRGLLARKHTQGLRKHQQSIVIQKWVRRWRARTDFVQVCGGVIALQALLRSNFAVTEYHCLRREQAAIKMQSVVRMWCARTEYRWAVRAIITVQNLERRRRAKAELKQLKMAERDVSALKEKNWGLENKVMELQRKLDESNAELKKLRAEAVLASVAKEAEAALNAMRKERDHVSAMLVAAERDVADAQGALTASTARVAELEALVAEEKKLAAERAVREKELTKSLEAADAENRRALAMLQETEAKAERLNRQAQKERKDKRAAVMTVLGGAVDIHGSPMGTPPQAAHSGAASPVLREAAALHRSGVGGVPLAEHLELTKRMEAMASANATALKEKEGMQQRLEAAARELAGVQQQLALAQQQKDSARSEVATLSKLLANVSQQPGGSQDGALADAIQDALGSSEARAQAERELHHLNSAVQRLQAERDQAVEALRQVEEAMNGPHADRGGARDSLAMMEARIAQATAENTELRARIAQMQRSTDSPRRASIVSLEAHLQDENRQLREELGSLYKKLREVQANSYGDVQGLSSRRSASISSKPSDGVHRDLGRQASIGSDREGELISAASMAMDTAMEDQGIIGMFKFDERDERALINELILNADPRKLAGELPGTIAYVIFMCIKYSDYINNAKQLQSLLTNSISTIKHVVMKHHTHLELLGFWLANSNVLLNSMHYSEEVLDENCDYELENFDLTEYRQVLEDLAAQMYFAIVRHVQDELSKIVVPAVLENDLLQGVMSGGGLRKPKQRGKTKSIHDVTTVLNELHRTLNDNCVDPELTQQMFVQLAYFISATCLNNLLLRKDLCNWSKGLQIQFNISHLEGWLRDNKLESAKIRLVAIAQATKLLQMPKHTLEDIEPIMTTCTDLNYMQIQKILTMYTPDAVEERVPVSVIREIERVGKRRDTLQNRGLKPSLMLDLTAIKAPQIVYTNPTQKLAQVQLPAILNLDFLEKM